ncbi:MAG: hypothetical protein JWN17_2466 [Frankiales bacterium]|nr:hypothetical protein [Frankiales bacterium]
MTAVLSESTETTGRAPAELGDGPAEAPGKERAGSSARLRRPAALDRLVSSVRAVPHAGTYAGIGLAALGVVLLAVAWGKVAGLTNVALQLPYVVSAGFIGLALVACGLTVISVTARQAEGVERRRQIAELRDVLAELRALVAQPGDSVDGGQR